MSPNGLLTTRDLAEVLKMSETTLETWRSLGRGPPFVRLEKVVRYRRQDVAAWIKADRRQSTRDVVVSGE